MSMKNNQILLPPQVLHLIERLEAAGEEAWIVGGCVRDSLMGKIPHDWDMTTSASTGRMKEIFSDKRLLLNGEQHGTVGVIEDGAVYEITTYRIESGCSDHRHPDAIRFTREIREDLSRRDFTINAMAYHPGKGLLDCFGGEEDIKNKIIRCVGDPKLRFEEDALRILRAVRFSSVLGFSIQQESIQAACDKAKLLCEISAERICEELCKALCGRWVSQTFALKEVWEQIFPELDVLDDEIQRLPKDAFLRLIWLYHSQGKRAKDALVRLKAPKAESKREEALWEILQNTPETVVDFRRCLNAFEEKTTEDFLSLLFVSHHLDEKARQQLLDTFARAKEGCCSLSDLQIDGRQLLEAGCPKGKKVGEILNQLLEECMQEVLQNHTEKLIERAKQLF